MRFYEQYPMMMPYVGKDFHSTGIPSLLLIGESHYVPCGSKYDTTPESWYSVSSETLPDDELYYISTAQLIKDSRGESFSNKAHSIWRNSFMEINQYGPAYADFTHVADNIAFYNFFLRPAFTGKSLVVTPQDVKFANKAFYVHFEVLKPTAVIFLSRLAHNHFHSTVPVSVPIIATPHPGCQWWNRKSQKYGNKRGRDILADFIKTTKWLSCQTPNDRNV